VGDTVIWEWVEQGPHTTTACSDSNFDQCGAHHGWDSGVQSEGTFSHTFSSAGSFYYRCDLHFGMWGRVDVLADSDGDGWSDGAESVIGTDPAAACGPDAWPADIDNDGFVDTGDIGVVTNNYGDAVPRGAPHRQDLAPDPPLAAPDAFIDIGDIARLTGVFGQGCSQ
jgi:hypothetical protein